MATATLNAVVNFAVGSVGDDATHWTLWDAANGGNRLWTDTVVGDPAALVANQFFQVPANMLVITQPVGVDGATPEMARRGAAGMVIGTTYVQMHSADPGANGTANILTAVRAAIVNGSWTVAQ